MFRFLSPCGGQREIIIAAGFQEMLNLQFNNDLNNLLNKKKKARTSTYFLRPNYKPRKLFRIKSLKICIERKAGRKHVLPSGGERSFFHTFK